MSPRGPKTMARTRTLSPVQKLRNDLGLSRAEFARLMGASERSLSDWESGEEPRQAHARLLTQLLRLHATASTVMKPEFVGTWLRTPLDALGGLKPMEAIERGELDRVWRLLFAVESGGHA